MKNRLKKRHSWRTLICALLIAALAMMGAVAENALELEVNLEGAMNESGLNVTVDDKAVSDNTGIAVELDGEGVPVDDTPVSGELELDGLNLSDGFGAELTQAGDATDENAGLAATNSNPEDFEIDDNGVLVKYVGPGGDVVIPEGVTSIGERAFEECTGVSTVSIPNGVVSIDYQAFARCDNLTHVDIPDSVTSIGVSAFTGCGLTSVTVPESVDSLGHSAFFGCESLEKAEINANITVMESFLFYGCKSLKSVSMPLSVTTFERGVFSYCTSLTGIDLPDGLTCVGNDSFYRCEKLTEVVFPKSVTEIWNSVFAFCTSLRKVVIQEGVTKIGEYVFYECNDLTIYGRPGSYAEQFAKENDIPFEEYIIRPVSISITQGSAAKLIAGKTLVLEAVVEPLDAETTLVWSTSDAKVATVTQEGEVTAVNKGTATITVATDNGKKASFKVTVPQAPDKILLKSTKATVFVGEQLSLEAMLEPKGAKTELTWDSSDVKVATVTEDGIVKAVKKGTAAITVRTANGKKATCKITVPEAPTKVTLNKTKATVVVGAKLKLTPKLNPKTAETTLKWTSSNPKVATVTQKGVVKALKEGTAVITVKTSNGKKATCKITVPTAPTKVAFAKKAYSVKVGKTVKLTAKLTPAKARTTLTWTTSDKKIATVTQKGVVKGVKKGTATITVKTANGKKASVKVVVK